MVHAQDKRPSMKEYKDAKKIYKQLLERAADNQIVSFNAATFYEKYMKDYPTAKKILDDYRSLKPEDEQVGTRLARIQETQKIEEERKQAALKKKKEAAERKKRQQEKFKALKTAVTSARDLYKQMSSCEAAAEPLMEVNVYIEQVEELIKENDFESAADAMPFIEEAQATMESLKEVCGMGGGGAAPEPAPEG